jgi:NAD(P)-dependent dehydrogenase (short-subunit alcohol dehydrogenase family)
MISRDENARMSVSQQFRLDGKRALIVGGATGMGAAAAELARDAGAEVMVMDRVDVNLSYAGAILMNLADRESIDRAVDAVTGKIDALFSCAGVADGTPGIERINFIGHRYLIDRLVDREALGRGSAIGMISSAAGLGWESNLVKLRELLDITDWDEAVAWTLDNGMADYMSTKQLMCAYVAQQAFPMFRRGIRINAICPGPTDTPLAQANKEMWLGFASDYRADVGSQPSTPMEQAYPLIFLCSDAAMAINGQTLVADQGYLAAGVTGAYPAAAPVADFLLGRLG